MGHGFLYALGEMFIPFQYRTKLKGYVLKAGASKVNYSMFGLFFLLDLIIAIGFCLFFLMKTIGVFALFVSPIVWVIFVGISMLLIWVYFEVKLFQRTEKIERVLPDFLEAVSVNLRAGMTFDKALWSSVEPEYDILSKEIEIVAKKVMTGKDTEEALLEFASKYNSPLLKESIDLIIVGFRSGGEISDMIDRVVENVKQASYLKKELVANVMSYVIFISMISLFIAPTLYALSYNLMLIMQDLGAKLASSGGSMMGGVTGFGSKTVNNQDFISFSKWSIAVIAITSSVIIADLREGSIKGSVKYVFVFLLISQGVYALMLLLFTAVFGSMVS